MGYGFDLLSEIRKEVLASDRGVNPYAPKGAPTTSSAYLHTKNI